MAGLLLMVEDGPAKDAGGLVAQRAPEFLRFVVDSQGHWDALDQLDDQVADDEQIYVYRRREGVGHVRGHGKGFSGPMVFYRHFPAIEADHVRDNVAWRKAVEAIAATGDGMGGT